MTTGWFDSRSDEDVLTLVDQNPLAWVCLKDTKGLFATAAPIRPTVTDGRLTKLVGHVPRCSRIADCLVSPREALVLVLGPNGYISPSWMSDRTQAPTWNFSSAQFLTEIELVDDPKVLVQHLRDLTFAVECRRDHAWRIEEMGARMQELSARIVAFDARVISSESRFKLGQDEGDQTYSDIVRSLEKEGCSELLMWMRRFNQSR